MPESGLARDEVMRRLLAMKQDDQDWRGGEAYRPPGSTESLLQAVKTARDVGRERGIVRPVVVCAESAHAAFTKAADYFDVDLVRVPVDADLRVAAASLEAACSEDTILVVASAPTYPHGAIDPVADI